MDLGDKGSYLLRLWRRRFAWPNGQNTLLPGLLSLPTELMFAIFLYLDTRDFLALARTSRHLHSIAMTMLYASVDLTSRAHGSRTLMFVRTISKKKDLAGMVKHLKIPLVYQVTSPFGEVFLGPIEWERALRHATNLRSLTLYLAPDPPRFASKFIKIPVLPRIAKNSTVLTQVTFFWRGNSPVLDPFHIRDVLSFLHAHPSLTDVKFDNMVLGVKEPGKSMSLHNLARKMIPNLQSLTTDDVSFTRLIAGRPVKSVTILQLCSAPLSDHFLNALASSTGPIEHLSIRIDCAQDSHFYTSPLQQLAMTLPRLKHLHLTARFCYLRGVLDDFLNGLPGYLRSFHSLHTLDISGCSCPPPPLFRSKARWVRIENMGIRSEARRIVEACGQHCPSLLTIRMPGKCGIWSRDFSDDAWSLEGTSSRKASQTLYGRRL